LVHEDVLFTCFLQKWQEDGLSLEFVLVMEHPIKSKSQTPFNFQPNSVVVSSLAEHTLQESFPPLGGFHYEVLFLGSLNLLEAFLDVVGILCFENIPDLKHLVPGFSSGKILFDPQVISKGCFSANSEIIPSVHVLQALLTLVFFNRFTFYSG